MLERFGFSATVFVVSGLIGGENEWEHKFQPRPRLKLLSAEEVKVVSERGMEVGSHGTDHSDLRGLEPEPLREKVEGSRKKLRELLGHEIEGFCYPYGSLDADAVEAVRAAGYGYACATATQRDWDEHALPRIPISQKDNLRRFSTKLSIYGPYGAAKERLRSVRRRASAPPA